MRAVIFVLIIAVLGAIAAVSTGMVSIFQTRPAQLPSVAASGGRIQAQQGQAPAFDVQTGSVGVGSKATQVPLPTVRVERKDQTVTVPALEVRSAQPDNQVNAQ